MPFPLAALGGAIVSAIAGASATTLIVGGVAATAAGVFTAAAISNHNDMKRARAREAAEREASREQERLILEKDRKRKEKEERARKNMAWTTSRRKRHPKYGLHVQKFSVLWRETLPAWRNRAKLFPLKPKLPWMN